MNDDLITVSNATGMSMTVSPYGARLVELLVPDSDGHSENVVLGFDTTDEYRHLPNLYFGATIGRVAGRIAGGRFVAPGVDLTLEPNEGDTHLHGGPRRAFDRVEWRADTFVYATGRGVAFSRTSEDGEEGYAGALRVRVEYVLTDANEVWFNFGATADRPTPVNLTNHTYWNLSSGGARLIVDHQLRIAARRTVATTPDLLPAGGTTAVAGTALDYTTERRIGSRLPEGGSEPWPGIDDTYVLDEPGTMSEPVASRWDPESGRYMEMFTSEPTLQVYTANRLPSMRGRGGRSYRAGGAICIEAQRVPDSPHLPDFPSIVLQPGVEYSHSTGHRFSTRLPAQDR